MLFDVEPYNLDLITSRDNMGVINHMEELTEITSYIANKKVIAGFDWDNCISLTNGCNLPLRDPKKSGDRKHDPVSTNSDGKRTIKFFNFLNENNINWFVLTARLNGDGFDEIVNTTEFPITYSIMDKINKINNCIFKGTSIMWEALPGCFENHKHSEISKLFTNNNVIELTHIDIIKNVPEKFTTYLCNNVIYAGASGRITSNKGRAFIRMIIHNYLPNDFDYVMFVDNDDYNLHAVIDEFTKVGLRHKLLPIFFPQNPKVEKYGSKNPAEGENLGPCITRMNFNSCLQEYR